MTGSHNLALQTSARRAAMQADLIACRIRWQCKDLKGAEKQKAGTAALSALSLEMQAAVVEALKARASSADRR